MEEINNLELDVSELYRRIEELETLVESMQDGICLYRTSSNYRCVLKRNHEEPHRVPV